jgi:predicted nucleic-acid-binding protein
LLIGIDTNVVIRLIVEDDIQQVSVIRQHMAVNEFFISLTVLLETEWVLRSRYAYSRAQIVMAFVGLFDLERTHIECSEWFLWMVEQYEQGLDFGDMIHIVAVRNTSGFITFDQKIKLNDTENSPAKIHILTV